MATPRKPIPKDRFLLWMLAAIFSFQAGIFAVGLIKCSSFKPEEVKVVCPDLGRRYDQTFGVMIATVLALLGATRGGTTEN